MSIISHAELGKAKRAYSTRRIDLRLARMLVQSNCCPKAGDLVLARVDKLGHHDGVEEITGRRASLYPGDEVLLCYGNRYAPDQFEALVPDTLGPCQLVAAGGLAAKAVAWHSSMRPATEITPLGLIAGHDGRPLNIRQFRLPALAEQLHIPVIVSVGTSMNSGKTTTAARLIRTLFRLGLRVGAAKVTGTSAGKDTWLMADSGARATLDFNDAGFATTFMEPLADVETGALNLLITLQSMGCEIAVVEIADGLLQAETRQLLQSPAFNSVVTAIIHSSVDSMGSAAGAEWLKSQGLPVAALAGVMTNSPLAAREAALASALPVLGQSKLLDAEQVLGVFPFVRGILRHRPAQVSEPWSQMAAAS